MSVTKLFAAIGVVALLGGIVAGLMPATTTVEASLLPDIPLVDVALQLGGKVGISIEPDNASFRIDCGSTFARNRYDFDNTNVVVDALGIPGRVEAAIETSCDTALDSRSAVAMGALGLGVLLLLISTALALVKGVGRAAGSVWKAATRTQPAARIPPVGIGESGVADLAAPQPERLGGTVRKAAAVGTLIVVVGIVALAMNSGSEKPIEVAGAVEIRVDPEAQACVRQATEESNAAIEGAYGSSTIDRENAALNLDGNSSFMDAAETLRGVDLGLCPAQFKITFAGWSDAWMAFGVFADEASKPHAPWNDEWSESSVRSQRCAHARTIRDLSDELSKHLAAADVRAAITTMAACS